MGFYNMLPELLLLVADNLAPGDIANFRSTCFWLRNILTSRFQKLCLKNHGDLTTIQWAAIRGHSELIKLAIMNGADLEAPFLGKLTITILDVPSKFDKHDPRHPCKVANDDLFFAAIKTRIRTPLFLAACCGHAKAIEVLLEHGASRKCSGGIMTSAHAAASRGDVACMQVFVRPGFDINAQGVDGCSLLHDALIGGIEMMKYILQLEGGTNLVNARTIGGLTPLHSVREVDRALQGLEIELLLQHGADMYAKDNDGDLPAELFASRGYVESLQILIEAGYDWHTIGQEGQTILHCALTGGKEIVEYLLNLEGGKALIEIEDNFRLTALDYALESSKWEIEGVLCRHGARRRPLKTTV